MDRREFLAASLGAGLTAASGATRRPNIVLVLADDLGWAELGCYGSRFNRTPNLDRMAARSVRFTDAYSAAPVCSPTRASIMTGQHPARLGITDYLRPQDEKYLTPDHRTLPKALKPAGYVSGLIGKWHLMGDYATRKGDPKLHGFDEVICSETKGIGGGSYFYPYAFMPEVKARREGEYLTDRLNQEAVDFIERHKSQPFFLYLAHYATHTKLAGKPGLVEKYKKQPGAGTDRNNPELAAMLESIDDGIGMIGATLERLGLGDDTVLIFMSDNGGETRVTTNGALRGGKSQLYEGGIRVPMMVRRAGLAPGVCHSPVTSTDLYPTILEMAGVRKGGGVLDGEPLQPLLARPSTLRSRTIAWHYPLEKAHFLGGRSAGALHQGDFKLIDFFDDGHSELYNLKEDPGERNDLAARLPAKTAELKKALADWRTRTIAKG